MNPPTVTPSQVRRALLLREEIALLDVRHEAAFATGHPLCAANMAAGGDFLRPAVLKSNSKIGLIGCGR
jgi:rhodanese-related sulfurtransferase